MSTRKALAWLTVAACVLLVPAMRAVMQAQQNAPSSKPSATASVTGQVVDADTGAAVPGAIVELTVTPPPPASATNAPPAPSGPRNNPPVRVLTDANGQFVFKAVAVGNAEFRVTAHNYAGGGYNQLHPESEPQALSLADGEHVDKITLKMWRTGAISGRVVDEAGDPVVGVSVQVLRRVMNGGQLTWQLSGAGRTTDDRGVYRSSGLLAGDYLVEVPVLRTTMAVPTSDADARRDSFVITGEQIGNLLVATGPGRRGDLPAVIARDSRLATYPTVFHPSSPTMSHATVISLRASEEKSNIDVQLTLVPAFTVGGLITDVDGLPAANVEIALMPPDEQSSGEGMADYVAISSTGARGEFTMLGVPAGQYQMVVLRYMPSPARGGGPAPATAPVGTGTWARQPIAVIDSDITDIAMRLRPSPLVSGRAVFNGASTAPTAQQLGRAVRLEPASAGMRAVVRAGAHGQALASPIGADGSFTIAATLPGKYMMLPTVSPALKWIAASITAGGRDVSDVPIDIDSDLANVLITFTDKPGALGGSVNRSAGATDTTALVVGFPSNPLAWGSSGIHTFSTRTTVSGTYTLTSIAPGDYLVAAIPGEIAQSWQVPETFKRIAAAATRVTIGEGMQLTQNLVTVSIK